MPLLRKQPERQPSLLGLALSPVTWSLKKITATTASICDRVRDALHPHAQSLRRLRDIAPDEIDALLTVANTYKRIGTWCRNALEDALYPKTAGPGRSSRAATPMVLSLGMMMGGSAAFYEGTKPVEPSPAISGLSMDSDYEMDLPDPSSNIQDIIWSLHSVNRMHAFAKKNITIVDAPFPVTFLNTYCRTIPELQKAKWKCPCNGAVEFYGELLHAHSTASRRITIAPNGPRMLSNGWHQFLIIEHESSITVLNNTEEPQQWESLEGYMVANYSEMHIVANSKWIETGKSIPSRLMGVVHGATMPSDIVRLHSTPISVADAR